jgi:hypothetical protein
MLTVREALPRLTLNVPLLARKTTAEVERILGKPSKCAGLQLNGQVRNIYRNGAIEIVFVEGKASWIKLFDTRDLVFGIDALPKLGLPPVKPTYVNRKHVMSWGNVANLKEVSLYSNGHSGVSYVLICASVS